MEAKLQEIVEQIEALEPFPTIAIRVLEASMAEPDPLELALIVKLDAGITAKVLRLANSAAKSAAVPVESLDQAAVKLGSAELTRLVLASAAHSFYSGLGSSTPRSNRSLWVESMTNAIAAGMVAQARQHDGSDVAFTVGLLMNMGHVVMDRFVHVERDEILGRVDTGMTMLRAEKEVLGATHAELGGRMATDWGFPDSLCDAILHHHSPDRGINKTLCADANLAEALTWHSLGEDGAHALAYGLSASTMEHSGVVPDDMIGLRDSLPLAVEAQRYLLALD